MKLFDLLATLTHNIKIADTVTSALVLLDFMAIAFALRSGI